MNITSEQTGLLLYALISFSILGFILSLGGFFYYCILLEPDRWDVAESIISIIFFGYISLKFGKKLKKLPLHWIPTFAGMTNGDLG
jgi:hypothetical protein